jgi:hypothetical protein
MRGLADCEDDVVRQLRQQQHVAEVGVECLLEHAAGLTRGDHDQRRAGVLAQSCDLRGGERRLTRGEEDAVEMAAGKHGGRLADLLALPDEVELGVGGKLFPQRVEAVAGADQVDADTSVAHRIPPDCRTDWMESRRSGLSVASTAGRSSSVQSAFFITK